MKSATSGRRREKCSRLRSWKCSTQPRCSPLRGVVQEDHHHVAYPSSIRRHLRKLPRSPSCRRYSPCGSLAPGSACSSSRSCSFMNWTRSRCEFLLIFRNARCIGRRCVPCRRHRMRPSSHSHLNRAASSLWMPVDVRRLGRWTVIHRPRTASPSRMTARRLRARASTGRSSNSTHFHPRRRSAAFGAGARPRRCSRSRWARRTKSGRRGCCAPRVAVEPSMSSVWLTASEGTWALVGVVDLAARAAVQVEWPRRVRALLRGYFRRCHHCEMSMRRVRAWPLSCHRDVGRCSQYSRPRH